MKKRLFAITLIVASLLLAGCGIDSSQLAGSVNNVPVPNIIGMSLQDATTELTSAGLQIGDTVYKDSSEDKDTVLQSDPLPGTSVECNSKINLTLSSGEKRESTLTVEVPVPETNEDVTFTVYVDGQIDSSYTTTVNPAERSTVFFKFRGSKGAKQVKVRANDQDYKTYKLDFDKKHVIEIK